MHLQDAPYLLEPLVAELPAQALRVRLALLTAAAKLFFARPPECQGLLGSALAAAAADADQDVHDRGLLYYRSALLQLHSLSGPPSVKWKVDWEEWHFCAQVGDFFEGQCALLACKCSKLQTDWHDRHSANCGELMPAS